MRRADRNTNLFWLSAVIRGLLLCAVLAGLTSGGYSTAFAQDPQPISPTDDEVNAIAKQLYCPVCENVPLDVCPTQACAQWRELIRQKLSEGWSEQQILDYFVEQYGERVLGAPPARGINWLFYLVPPLAIIAGVFILVKALQSMRARPAPGSPVSPATEPAADEYVRRLEEELHKRD